MGKDYTNCKRAFFWTTKAWYFTKMDTPDITFGLYDSEGGTPGEMSMEWVDAGNEQLTPRLKAYSDSWSVLVSFSDLLQKMAEVDEERPPTEEQFVKMLADCGFEDRTPYKGPYDAQETALRIELSKLEEKADTIRRKLGIERKE